MRILHAKYSDVSITKARLGPYEIQSLIEEKDEAAATAYRVRIEPHSQTNTSYHRIAEEMYYVLEGMGVAILDGEKYTLQAGDFLRLPPGTQHSFVTQEVALLMLDIHCPGSRPHRDVYFVDATPEGFSATQDVAGQGG